MSYYVSDYEYELDARNSKSYQLQKLRDDLGSEDAWLFYCLLNQTSKRDRIELAIQLAKMKDEIKALKKQIKDLDI